MAHRYDYSRKRGQHAGHRADARRDFRRVMTMLAIGGVIIAGLLYLIISR